MHSNAKKRQEILTELYKAREAQANNQAKDGWVSGYDLKNAIGNIDFGLSVLIETGQVKQDGNRFQITGVGVVAFEDRQEEN